MNTAKNAALPADTRREGNIEWLRIVSMLLILGHHLAWHGMAMNSPVRENQLLATFLFAGGQTGVNCFVLITGYFLSPFRSRRFFATLLQTLFYSVGIALVLKWTGLRQDVTGETLWNSALVISRSPYWFVTMYLALTAMLPLLQPGVKSMSRRAHGWVVALCTVYLSVIPTATLQNPSSQFFHQITWFVYLYVLGAYFRRFPNRFFRCVPLQAALFLASLMGIMFLCLWGRDHQELFQRVGSRQNFFADKNALPQLICSCSLFLFFSSLKIKPRKALSLLSGASFGVYLIHDHGLLRGFIWGNWLQVWQSCQRKDFWLLALLAPLGLYLACAAVDLVRRFALEAPLMRFLQPMFNKLDGWLSAGE